MDRPKSSVRVIRGVATVHVAVFLWASSDLYRFRYLGVFDYVSVSLRATGAGYGERGLS